MGQRPPDTAEGFVLPWARVGPGSTSKWHCRNVASSSRAGKQLSIMDEFRVIFLELALMEQGLASSLSAGP